MPSPPSIRARSSRPRCHSWLPKAVAYSFVGGAGDADSYFGSLCMTGGLYRRQSIAARIAVAGPDPEVGLGYSADVEGAVLQEPAVSRDPEGVQFAGVVRAVRRRRDGPHEVGCRRHLNGHPARRSDDPVCRVLRGRAPVNADHRARVGGRRDRRSGHPPGQGEYRRDDAGLPRAATGHGERWPDRIRLDATRGDRDRVANPRLRGRHGQIHGVIDLQTGAAVRRTGDISACRRPDPFHP